MWRRHYQEKLKEMQKNDSEPREGDRLYAGEDFSSNDEDSNDAGEDIVFSEDSEQEEKIKQILDSQNGGKKSTLKRRRDDNGEVGDEDKKKVRKIESKDDIEMYDHESASELIKSNDIVVGHWSSTGEKYINSEEVNNRMIELAKEVKNFQMKSTMEIGEVEVVEEVMTTKITPIKLTKKVVPKVNISIKKIIKGPPEYYAHIKPFNCNRRINLKKNRWIKKY